MSIASNFPAIRPSLLLDFAGTRQLDPRITFTRASTATFYDDRSSVMAEQNLLAYSQQFDNAYWTKGSVTISSTTTVAPDGTATAATISLNGLYQGPYRASIPCLGSTAYTLSVWLKWVSGNTALSLSLMTFPNNQTSVQSITVTGTWTRFTFTLTTAAGQTAFAQVIPVQDRNASGHPTVVQIWGAQLEERNTVTTYTPTTTVAITNYIPTLQTAAADVARFDCNPTTRESLGLLMEESRTNLFTYSSDVSDASWTKQGSATVTVNTNIAPDGTLTADTLNLPTTSDNVLKGFAVGSAGVTHTLSVWLAGTGTTYIGSFDNVSSGQVTLITLTSTLTRYSFTFTFGAGSTDRRVYIASRQGSGSTTTSVIAWGAQLEVGAFATSYIPTVASTVTRAADVASMTGTNFSSWYNAGEGTVYSDAKCNGINTASFVGQFNEAADGPSYIDVARYQTTLKAIINISGTAQANLDTGLTSASPRKTAFAFKTNDFALSADAGTVLTDTSGNMPTVNRLYIGSTGVSYFLNGTIKRISYYPLRLTNTQLQALTIL